MLCDPLDEENYHESLGQIFTQWQKNREIKIDNKIVEIIQYFIHNVYGHAYGCHKSLNERKKGKFHYKTVNESIQKLQSLGILTKIDDVKEKKVVGQDKNVNARRAIYYEISQFGIFFILSKKITGLDIKKKYKALFDNHEDSYLFKCMLFRVIPLEIIKEIKSALIWDSVTTYMQNYIAILEKIFEFLNRQKFIINSIQKIKGLINIYALHPNPMIENVTVENFLMIHRLCKELGRPRFAIKENKESDLRNDKDLISVYSNDDREIDYILESQNQESKDNKKVKLFKKSDYGKNLPVLEFEVLGSSLTSIPSFYDKFDKCYYIPLPLGTLMKWVCENNGNLNNFIENIIKLILDISNIKYHLTLMLEINGKNFGVKDITEDLKRLQRDINYMNFFDEAQDFINDSLKTFPNKL